MEALLHSAGRWRVGAVTVVPAEAGLQTVGWLAPGFDDRTVSERAAEAGVEVGHLSRYCIDTARPAGLVFGFGAFDEGEIDGAARVLAGVLEREAGKRQRLLL